MPCHAMRSHRWASCTAASAEPCTLTLAAQGGDVIKFAGDAAIVIWARDEDLDIRCSRAINCAMDIQGAGAPRELAR